MELSKTFSVKITSLAHQRLRAASEKLGLGQNYVLSLMLEELDFEPLRERAEAVKNAKSKPTEAEIAAFLKAMSPEEREKLLATMRETT